MCAWLLSDVGPTISATNSGLSHTFILPRYDAFVVLPTPPNDRPRDGAEAFAPTALRHRDDCEAERALPDRDLSPAFGRDAGLPEAAPDLRSGGSHGLGAPLCLHGQVPGMSELPSVDAEVSVGDGCGCGGSVCYVVAMCLSCRCHDFPMCCHVDAVFSPCLCNVICPAFPVRCPCRCHVFVILFATASPFLPCVPLSLSCRCHVKAVSWARHVCGRCSRNGGPLADFGDRPTL